MSMTDVGGMGMMRMKILILKMRGSICNNPGAGGFGCMLRSSSLDFGFEVLIFPFAKVQER